MAAKAKTLFERASAAKPRTEKFPVPLVDNDYADALARTLSEAQAEDKVARQYGSAEEKTAAAEKLAKAKADFEAAHEIVRFRGLTALELDALSNEHPDPPDGEESPEGDTPFIYWLAVASATPSSPFTAEQWRSLCEKSWSAATAGSFRQLVLNVNGQAYSTGLPKEF